MRYEGQLEVYRFGAISGALVLKVAPEGTGSSLTSLTVAGSYGHYLRSNASYLIIGGKEYRCRLEPG